MTNAGSTASAPRSQPASAVPSWRQIVAVVIGNGLEFYDFLIYSFFAVQIGDAFFPAQDRATSLLAALATFGVGFLARPVGAVVLGRVSDRVGRKPAMILSFSLMGASIFGMAVTPGYATLGPTASALLVFYRIIQGFAVGGEVGSSTAFLLETAPPARRGLLVSLQHVGQDGAILCAGLIGFAVSNMLDPAQLAAWGWRLAFLVGAAIIPFGLRLRGTLIETMGDADFASAPSPRSRSGILLCTIAFIILAAGTSVGFNLNYMVTYATATLGLPSRLAFGATIAAGLSGLMFDPIGGWLSDRYGRKPIMIAAWLVVLAAVLPAFALISRLRAEWALLSTTALLAAANSIATSATLVSISENLPKRSRSSSLGIIYAAAISIFGGSVQFVVTWLLRITGDPMMPAWYMAAAVGLGLIAMIALPETAPARRFRRQPSFELKARR